MDKFFVVGLTLGAQVNVLHMYQFLRLTVILWENNVILIVYGSLLHLSCSSTLLWFPIIVLLGPSVLRLTVALLKDLKILGLNLWMLLLRWLRVRKLGVFLRSRAFRKIIQVHRLGTLDLRLLTLRKALLACYSNCSVWGNSWVRLTHSVVRLMTC